MQVRSILVNISKWHQTAGGLSVFAAAELLLAYGFASLAIDRGSWWWYGLMLITFIGTLRNFIRLIRKIFHVHQSTKA
jgi:hypothetical protein